MKKTLLLSVVASTMIMAGGSIAPVEPVVEAPAPAATASGWDWSGTAKVYYQTMDHENFALGNGPVVGNSEDFFNQNSSAADAGIQLRVKNKDIGGGFGFGAEVTGLSTLGLVDAGVVTASMMSAGTAFAEEGTPEEMADDSLSTAYISQAYLTYGIGNTSIKVGRQELPKSLSPFAFSEDWNIFKNTFEAALIVNTDITDTTLVGAYVSRANGSQSVAGSIVAITATSMHDLSNWSDVGDSGTFMLTAQNKSVDGLTITGSFYYAPGFEEDGVINNNTYLLSGYGARFNGAVLNNGQDIDAMVLWGDLAYNKADFPVTFGAQGGFISADGIDDDTTAYGVKIGGKIAGFALSAAYTGVDIMDDLPALTVTNFGTGVKSPLYTQQVLNQVFIDGHFGDADTWQIKGVYKGLGGKFIAQYAQTDVSGKDDPFGEFDFIYATKFNTSAGDLGLKVMWINQSFFAPVAGNESQDDTNNVLRLIASYDF